MFEDLHDYMKSLKRLEAVALAAVPSDASTRIYPGHGPMIEDGVAEIRKYMSHREAREAQILGALEAERGSGLSPLGLVRAIYPKLACTLFFAAGHNVTMHLKKLEKEGRVEKYALLGPCPLPRMARMLFTTYYLKK